MRRAAPEINATVIDRRYSSGSVKRLPLVLIIVVLAFAAIAYTLHLARKGEAATVASLLPQDTIGFVHVPDFKRTRDQWHRSDIYQLFHEPAVHEFLHKPVSRIRKANAISQILQELEQLAAKDMFLGLTSVEPRNAGFIAGLRFHGSRDAAETITNRWRAKLLGKNMKLEKVAYREHQIEIGAAPALTLATVYDKRWFFASNDLERLKQLLDRADGRQDRQSPLQSDAAYRAAMAHMPPDYAALVYLQPKTIAEKLAAIAAAFGQPPAADQQATLHRMNSICVSTRFERGKIHDVLFTGVDRGPNQPPLTRSSIALGTADTFFYLATLLEPKNWSTLGATGGFTPVGRWLEKFFQVLSVNGVTADEWNSAFVPELSSLAEWPATAHWPSFIMSVPVKDPARANKLANVLTAAIDEDGRWTKSEKDGVTYLSLETPVRLFALTPTIAVSDRLLVAGIDPGSVEAAIKRSKGSAGLSSSQAYQAAARSLPRPTNFFAYIDMARLYSRLDATLRPMLLFGAAFLPAISDRVDLDKLPPPETVTKHLSPIVSSQRYERDGYVAESIGPVTFNQVTLALAVAVIYSSVSRQAAH